MSCLICCAASEAFPISRSCSGEIGLPMTILTFLCLPLIISDGSMNIPMLNLMRSALNIESIT